MSQLISSNDLELIFKSFLNSLFKLDSNGILKIDENIAIILTSWFNKQQISIISPKILFNNYYKFQLKKIWYIIYTIQNNQLLAYKLNSIDYTLFIHKQSFNNLLSFLDLNKLKCSTCGHFINLQHSCYHLIALYISTSTNSQVPYPTISIINNYSQFDF